MSTNAGKVRFIASSKGRQLLVHKNYTFIKVKQGAGNKIIWRCTEWKPSTDRCKGRCHTDSKGAVIFHSTHNHPPDPAKIATKEFSMALREEAKSSSSSSCTTAQIIANVAKNAPIELVTALPFLPNITALRKSVQRARKRKLENKIDNTIPTPTTDTDEELSNEVKFDEADVAEQDEEDPMASFAPSLLSVTNETEEVEIAFSHGISLQDVKVEVLSLNSTSTTEAYDQLNEISFPAYSGSILTGIPAPGHQQQQFASVDKMRMSFLEEETKHYRVRLNRLEKETRFILAHLNLITNWISTTFDFDVINKNSTAYKKWTKNSSHDWKDIEVLAKSFGNSINSGRESSLRSASVNTNPAGKTKNSQHQQEKKPSGHGRKILHTDVQPLLKRNSQGKKVASNKNTIEVSQLGGSKKSSSRRPLQKENESRVNSAKLHPPSQKRLPTRSCKKGVKYNVDPLASEESACEEEEQHLEQVDDDDGDEDFIPEEPVVPVEALPFIKPDPSLFEEQNSDFSDQASFMDEDDEENEHDEDFLPALDDLGNSTDTDNEREEPLPPAAILNVTSESTNSKDSTNITNLEQLNLGNRTGVKYWSYFITRKDPRTRRYISNNCKYCHKHVSPRLLRLIEHITKKCGVLGTKQPRKKRKPNMHSAIDELWNLFEWKAKKSILSFFTNKTNLDPEPDAPPLVVSTQQSLTSLKNSKQYNLYCKDCHVRVSPRLHRLREHVHGPCGEGKKRTKKYNPNSGRLSLQSVWSNFEWRLKSETNENEEKLRQLKESLSKLPRRNHFFKASKKFNLICKHCKESVSPRLQRLTRHLEDECGKPKPKKCFNKPLNSGRKFNENVWGHFMWRKIRNQTSINEITAPEPPPSTLANASLPDGEGGSRSIVDNSDSATTTEPTVPPVLPSSSSVNPAPAPVTTIIGLRRQNLDCVCKYCEKRVCPRICHLVTHLRKCKNFKADEERDSFISQEKYQPKKDDGARKRVPKQCEECGRVVQGSLSRHYKTHIHMKATRCEVCQQCFRGQKSLREHISSEHHGIGFPGSAGSIPIPDLNNSSWNPGFSC